MLYARMLEVTADLYGMPELKTKAQKLKETIRTQSFNGKFFIDNAIRENGVLVPQKNNRSETCQYYTFYFKSSWTELCGQTEKTNSNRI